MAKNNYKIKEEPLVTGEKPGEKKGYIKDFITEGWIKATPENKEAKVIFEERLVKEYGYSKEQIQPEFGIKKGSKFIGPADIVVFRDEKHKQQEDIYIIVECKRKERTDGIEQLKSYLAPTQAKYGVWFNGDEIAYIKHLDKPPYYQEVLHLPRKGEKEGFPKKLELKPVTNLLSVFKTCHNYIYANEGLSNQDTFDEFLKILFIKMADEKSRANDKVQFWITDDEEKEILEGKSSEFFDRIDKLFDEVKKRYYDIFDENEKINLKKEAIAFVVAQIKNFNFSLVSTDVKGAAFQTFIHSHYRGERGQFFTPSPITHLCVEMLEPKQNELIIDPACGSGGFLVTAMKYVVDKSLSKQEKEDPNLLANFTKEYAENYIRGVDINPRLARVAKMRMVLEDDGHTGIFSSDVLDSFSKIKARAQEMGATKIKEEGFELLFTNPPFGSQGKVKNKSILGQYELAYKWQKDKEAGKWQKLANRITDDQVPDIIFIERCLRFLAFYGRMAILLPDGDLTNSSLGYVRQWLRENARILAVVSLPPETFVPYGAGVKASVLFLQKLPKKELETLKKKDYPIFMGIIEKIGYDIRGRDVYKRNERGEIMKKDGEPIIDEDVSLVIEEFKKFKGKYKMEF
ncbi:N-6 DNA methylase [Patescibacteria group bacterium]|nr:N-6 DNA methylase [Patescibacteria group bacterium]